MERAVSNAGPAAASLALPAQESAPICRSRSGLALVRTGLLGLAMSLCACAQVSVAPGASRDEHADPSIAAEPVDRPVDDATAPTGWHSVALPGKRRTSYQATRHDGRSAVHAQADTSASMWRRRVKVDPQTMGRMRFSWNVPKLIDDADLSDRDAEDSPVRIVLAFEGDHARLPLRDRLMFDLAETLTGERPPFATLMYVWDTRAPVGSVIPAARTDRVRTLVVESGPHRLRRWLHYERDVASDFRRMFGEEPGALVGVAVMTDSDNTASQTEAYYGEIELFSQAGRLLR